VSTNYLQKKQKKAKKMKIKHFVGVNKMIAKVWGVVSPLP